MLHGANFVHTFGRQYPLEDKYRLIIPHLMGFGGSTEHTFNADICVRELAEFIRGFGKRVMLVGFSLGAQLAYRLVSEYGELFECALIVSPWLIKDGASLSKIYEINLRQTMQMKNKFFCNIIGALNGLPRPARKEFVEQMQGVTQETIYNTVYNGISLECVSGFAQTPIPVVALAGAKEQDAVKQSVKRMAELNPNCKYEIWSGAAHNIPPVHYKKFNKLICQMY